MSATEDDKIPTPIRSKWGWAYWMVGIFLVFLGIVWGMEYARKQQGQAWIELVDETAYRPGDTIKGKAKLHAKKPLTSKHVTATVVFIKERDFGGAAESDITTVKHVLMTKVLTTNKIKFKKNETKTLTFELTLPEPLDIVGIEGMESGDMNPRWILFIETKTDQTWDMTAENQISIVR